MNESKEKYKILAMAILLGFCCFLTWYFHSIAKLGTVFTHFFYIPIILAALWWRRKGWVVAIVLAALLIYSHHTFPRDYVYPYNDYFRAIMFIGVFFVVAALSERIAKAQEKVIHLNAVLRAIRNVNQLIAKENDRDRLIQRACDNLVETRGYHSAWIALVDENSEFLTAADAGLNENFSTAVEMMKRGEFTRCGQNALKESGVKVFEDIATACADCPLMSSDSGRTSMVVRMEYDTRVCGILCVSIPTEMAADAVEQSLFYELAGDIAFGLHRIDLEKAREKAEEALRKLNEELESKVEERTKELVKERDYTRHLIESSPDFQMTLDKNGEIMDVNKAFEKIFNKNRNELIGTSIFEYLPQEATEKAIAQIFDKKKVRNIELTADRPGEGALICNLSGTVYTTPEGESGIYLTGRDITELKQVEEKLHSSERLVTIGKLSGSVAHELRQPLGVISNAIYYLKMTLTEADETTKEYLNIINDETRNAESIISGLLDIARTRPPDRQGVNIATLIEKALEKFDIPANIMLKKDVPDDVPEIFVDPVQIERVFYNLINNAIQAMSESEGESKGGELAIIVKSRDKEAKAGVEVSFVDTGVGIPEENMKKLFEPLFTTKARGIGLGLLICKNLVEANDGEIKVQSEVGKGTTVSVVLSGV